MPNVLSPRDIVSRPDNIDETVPHTRLTVLKIHVYNNVNKRLTYLFRN